MYRRLAAVIVAACLFTAQQALALGLGDIKVLSALNEPLRAEIALVGATSEELTGLEVRLASAEAFERYGLSKPTFMNSFKLRVSPTGTPKIEITSTQPVTDPFVTMLIEAVWPRGRLLREYTVLLDPPTYASPQPTAPPAMSRPAAPQRNAASSSGSVRRTNPTPATMPASSLAGAGQYRVERGDSLWKIASAMNPGDAAAINQAMIAIYDANPQAFNGNINSLRAGAVLTLPDQSSVFSISRSDALQAVRQQNANWRGSEGSLRLVPPDEDTGTGGIATRGTDIAGGSDGRSAAEVTALQRELEEKERLLALRNEELARLQDQLAQQNAPAAELPVEPDPDFSSQPELDAPLTADEIFAETQDSDDTINDSLADASDAADTDAFDVTDDALVDEPDAGEAEEPVADTPATTTPVPAVVTTSSSQADKGLLDRLLDSWVYIAGGAAVVLGLLGFIAVRQRAAAADDTGTWEALDAADLEDLDGTLAATGRLRDIGSRGGDTVRSPSLDQALPDDMLEQTAPVQETSIPEVTEATPVTAQEAPAVAPVSLDDTFSSETAINFDQSDPLKEADFHMAYGLFDQAAELVKGALTVDGQDPKLHAKLCEIFFQWGNEQGFVGAAEGFKAIGGDSDPAWNNVVIMGQQIAPTNELFSGAQVSAGGGDLDLSFDGDTRSIDAQLGAEQTDNDGFGEVFDGSGLTTEQPAVSNSIDFEFDDIGDDDNTSEQPMLDDSPTGQSPALDYSFDDGTVEQPLTMDDEYSEDSGNTNEIDLADLQLDPGTANELLDAGEELSSDLLSATGATSVLPDDFEVSLPADSEETVMARPDPDVLADLEANNTTEMPISSSRIEEADLDVADLTSEFRVDDLKAHEDATMEQPIVDSAPTMFADDAFGDGDDSTVNTGVNAMLEVDEESMGEVGTKLDLARAYVDMGDPEGARSILGEVVNEGDESQREEAQALLDSLG
ncbi:MAG: FimV/HubP family polar landmark protein [Pseudomonadota bacterium]